MFYYWANPVVHLLLLHGIGKEILKNKDDRTSQDMCTHALFQIELKCYNNQLQLVAVSNQYRNYKEQV